MPSFANGADAIELGDEAKLKTLLDAGLDPSASDGDTDLLWRSIRLDRPGCAKVLLSAGAQTDVLYRKNRTPIALLVRSLQAAATLAEFGVNLSAASAHGTTLLHQAAMDADIPLVKFLCELGVSINPINRDGCTPLDVAVGYAYSLVYDGQRSRRTFHGDDVSVGTYDTVFDVLVQHKATHGNDREGFATRLRFLRKEARKARGATAQEAERAELASRAADGDVVAAERLGGDCLFGIGGPKDLASAHKYLGLAAKGGHAGAQGLLGEMYMRGEGVKKDLKRSAIWARKAAERGDPIGQTLLGKHYFKIEATRNLKKAQKWFTKAAEQNHAQAQHYLADVLIELQHFSAARKWLIAAAQTAYRPACFELARMLTYGEGGSRDLYSAYRWILIACAHGPSNDDLGARSRSLCEKLENELGADQCRKAEDFVSQWKPEPPK